MLNAPLTDKVIAEHKENIQQMHRDWSEGQCLQEAQSSAVSTLAHAYHWWFGLVTDDARLMLQELLKKPASDEESNFEDSQVDESESPADDSTI